MSLAFHYFKSYYLYMPFYRLLFLVGAFSLSSSRLAVAMYSVPETRVVPVERLISNLEEKLNYGEKDRNAKARNVHQLARLCAMAYSLKLTSVKQFVPSKHSSREDPDFASIYPPASPYGEIGDDEREVPDPESGGNPQFLEKAVKYYKMYLEMEPNDWRGHMGLGWAHLLKGSREPAKASLRKALDLAAPADLKVIRHPHSFFGGSVLGAESGDPEKKVIFQDMLLPVGARIVEVAQANGQKQVLDVEKAALESLKAAAASNLVDEFSGLLPKFHDFIREWEKKRSPDAYRKFKELLPVNLRSESDGNLFGQNELDVNSYSFKSQFLEFGERFVFKSQAAKRADGDCAAMKGVAQFREFSIRNADACLIKKAYKEKNWGVCRAGMAEGLYLPFAFDVCISVIAARTKSKKICDDVDAFLGSLFKGFSSGKCGEAAKEGWGKAFEEDYYRQGQRKQFPSFIESFESYTPVNNDGAIRIIANVTRQGGAKIDHLILRQAQSRWQGEGQEKERRFSLPRSVAIRIPHKVNFSNRDGRSVGAAELSGFFMPTDADFIKRAENYDISASLGQIGAAEIALYLVPLLDKESDKEEINGIKRRVWKASVNYAMAARAVTPLALPLKGFRDKGHPVNDLITIQFDLDGSGIKQSWEWIKPSYGWLVYLPEETTVKSALQMFGAVTFWLFWRDGFESLCSLDDNRDGVIRASELKHIKIWNDQNLNGLQDKAEIIDLESQGITGLKCEGAKVFSQGLRLPGGVELEGGATRDLYDVWLKRK
jgi:hypothetical protein